MSIVIKRRVNFDFLGEDYAGAYLVFRSIPAVDFDEVMTQLKALDGQEQGSLGFIVEILSRYFIGGEFPDDGQLQPVSADDIGQLDAQSIIQCFKVFTGQEMDPKVETPLTSSSPTAESPPLNS